MRLGRQRIPDYSTLIADAWTVVQSIAARGLWFQMHNGFVGPHDLCWAGFTPHSASGWNGCMDYQADGETMPLAICRAALKAVESTRGEP